MELYTVNVNIHLEVFRIEASSEEDAVQLVLHDAMTRFANNYVVTQIL